MSAATQRREMPVLSGVCRRVLVGSFAEFCGGLGGESDVSPPNQPSMSDILKIVQLI